MLYSLLSIFSIYVIIPRIIMITSKKVTVIIPTYNRAKMLERAMKSVYEQNYRPIELLVVNNACTDDTDSVVGKFKNMAAKDLELVYIKRPNNHRDEARNEAIESASGDYICFLDDDDEFMKGKILKQIEHFNANPGIDVSFTNSYIENKVTTRISIDFRQEGLKTHSSELIAHRMCKGPFIPMVNVMAKASILKKERFNTQLHSHEDYELWLRLIKEHTFDWIDEPLSLIHFHDYASRYDTIQTKIDQANILFCHAPNFPRYFKDIVLRLNRLKNTVIKSYNDIDQANKARQFEADYSGKLTTLFADHSSRITRTNPPMMRYFKLAWVALLKKRIGLK